MRIAHIITAHKNPAQLELLIKTMQHVDFDFYVHIDKKFGIQPFEYLSKIDQVYFIKDRTVCNWGGFSLVKAVMKSIDQIEQSNIAYDFVNLLSAEDFPIKPINEIHAFFKKQVGFSFLSFDKSNDTEWWKKAPDRYKKYHFTDIKFIGKFFVERILNSITADRTFLDFFEKIYGGRKSTWWTITYDSALYLSAYFKKNPKLVKRLDYTWGCDEIIVATILMNSPYKNTIINENYRYVIFKKDESHPDYLTIDNYETIVNSDMMFARKFDLNSDDNILYKLNEYVSIG